MNDLTRQWLDIASQHESLETQWEKQSLFLNTQISILEHEQNVLQSSLNNRTQNTDDVDTQRLVLLEEQNSLEAQQEKLLATNEFLDIQIKRLRSMLPPLLLEQWSNNPAAANEPQTQDSATADLQRNLELLRLLVEFDSTVTIHEGLITLQQTEGQMLLVEQIYLGSSWAWFSTPDSTRAGIGYAGTGGWRWEILSDIEGQQVLQAIDVASGDNSPMLVSLPLLQNRVPAPSGSAQ